MAHAFPYTYYSCPCVDTSAPLPILTAATRKVSRETTQQPPQDDETSDEEETFDPTSSRVNFSLFPLERLLWCTECQEMRCPRCSIEEVICWYCPMCLFEVPSSTVRSEGNRCTRNCYNCPICTSPLTVNPLEAPPAADQSTISSEASTAPFILACGWCNWTSLDIGIKLEKHTNITGQLGRIQNGGKAVPNLREREALAEKHMKKQQEADPDSPGLTDEASTLEYEPDVHDIHFRLSSFYRNQVADSEGFSPGASIPLSSPGSISRLLNLYSGKKTKRNRPKAMRDATPSEGLSIFDPESEDAEIERRKIIGWEGTTSTLQREFQANHPPTFVNELRPVAALLRTKRGKRCKMCRTLLAKPDAKIHGSAHRDPSKAWKHRILALSHVPRVTLRPLNAPPSLGPSLSAEPSAVDHHALRQATTYQFLLTVSNPIFEPMKVTLATPAQTFGRIHSHVTILCPEFTIDRNSESWDDVLSSTSKRKSAILSSGISDESSQTGNPSGRQAEAGKVWSKGRNWTSVIVEIVPGLLPPPEEAELNEDDDLLEIAVFVRFEYEAEAGSGGSGGSGAVTGGLDKGKEKREDAFWCVLGAGRIVR